MEYIQCTHCHKKYRVTDQVRAASGRVVKCKACGEAMKIVIFESPADVAPAAQVIDSQNIKHTDELQDSSPTPPKSRESKPDEKTLNDGRQRHAAAQVSQTAGRKKKITLSAVLGGLIVAGSIYGFFQGRSHQANDLHHVAVLKQVSKADQKTAPSQAKVSHDNLPEQTAHSDIQPQDTAINHNAVSYSSACKEAAARQWINDFTLSHGQQNGADEIRLLDQGVQNSALIRQHCGGSNVVFEVLQAAQKGVPPAWLAKTVSDMTAGDSGNTTPETESMAHF